MEDYGMKKKFKNTVKRILAAAGAAALAASLLAANVPATAQAAENEQQTLTWTHAGGGWHYLDGTDISVYIDGTSVYIYGTGELPDFDYYYLYERPWDNGVTEAVYIADTITSIGKYAFYDIPTLQYISMYTSTFITDSTCFDQISYKPIYRLYDNGVSTEMIGTIEYTSLDSILMQAQTNYNGACWILDTYAKAMSFQNSTNPTVPLVYWATDEDAPWNNVEENGNGNVATVICKLSSETPNSSLLVSAQKRYQGRACLEAYAAFIGDYTFAATFNVTVEVAELIDRTAYQYWQNKTIKQTDTELKYVLTIPEEYRQAGRSFRLLAIGEGEVYIYDDLDTDNDTITFATSYPSTAYALVYKD